MKNLKIAAVLLFATATISAQDLKTNEVPAVVQNAFSTAHNNATDVEWEKKAEHYKVEFEVNNMERDIWYDSNGAVVKSEMEISEGELPAAVAKAVKDAYTDYKIDSIDVLEMNGEKTYEIEIEKGWLKERKLIIDATGKVISDLED
ncbi:putative PepSY-like beta-lactamase-inhibitor [Gelidibacter sediminis]|uniref:Putative PepSY-like beta-lactamase-inhibitor n=1 Tax=Gelidibacter sediminis TaxID=1608710 RepID=A0A4R7Q0E5_9FLAO|nr:PepSY-like domain-containing protein [Gelidibacter sediminis]TDU40069.1 putative PepSY-like beta-lactamase-inhibitor [Gelidibacter sediminis]